MHFDTDDTNQSFLQCAPLTQFPLQLNLYMIKHPQYFAANTDTLWASFFFAFFRLNTLLSVTAQALGDMTVTSQWGRWCLKSPTLRLFTQPFIQAQIKDASKLRFTGLCDGNSPVIGEFPAHRTSNAENVSIWWRHHVLFILTKATQFHMVRSCETFKIPDCALEFCIVVKWGKCHRRTPFKCFLSPNIQTDMHYSYFACTWYHSQRTLHDYEYEIYFRRSSCDEPIRCVGGQQLSQYTIMVRSREVQITVH